MSSQKKIIIGVVIIIIAVVAFSLKTKFIKDKQEVSLEKEEKELTREEIVSVLQQNEKGADYLEKNDVFEIGENKPLTKEDILKNQKEKRYKEIYQDLSPEDNKYSKVTLINEAGKGLFLILDLNNQKVVEIHDLILLKAQVKPEESN